MSDRIFGPLPTEDYKSYCKTCGHYCTRLVHGAPHKAGFPGNVCVHCFSPNALVEARTKVSEQKADLTRKHADLLDVEAELERLRDQIRDADAREIAYVAEIERVTRESATNFKMWERRHADCERLKMLEEK